MSIIIILKMDNYKLKGKDLYAIGYDRDASRSMAVIAIAKHFKLASKDEVMRVLTSVKNNPEEFLMHETLGKLANTFVEKSDERSFKVYHLKEEYAKLKVYGHHFIEEEARRQMNLAMKLPVSLNGALMPDAHGGYGLPIGGVLAVLIAVIPFGFGVDIGCRMALSVFDLPETYLQHQAFA